MQNPTEKMKTVKIKHVGGSIFYLQVGADLSEEDIQFIREFNQPIYCNDLTGKLWGFDTKLPSGRWLENIEPSNDLTTVNAIVL